jgi:hypothetical protein
MVQAIANFMKMAYVQWNKDSVADESIISDLKAMSNGELTLEENVNLNRVEYRTPPPNNNNRGRTNNQNNNPRNNNNPRSNNNNPRSNNQNNNNNNNNRNRNMGGKKY